MVCISCCSDNILLTTQIASVIPPQYFKAKRGIAYGIVHGGTGLGGAVLSFLINALIQKLGVAWAYRAIGILTLVTTAPVAFLIKERFPIRPTAFIEW
jgi:MFS family permease